MRWYEDLRGSIPQGTVREATGAADWVVADKVTPGQLWQHLCVTGQFSWRECEQCEAQCRFGARAVKLVRAGLMRDWTKTRQRRGNPEHQKNREWVNRAANHERNMWRAEYEVTRVWARMGRAAVDWQESLMEEEARLQREECGRPEWPEADGAGADDYLRNVIGVHSFYIEEAGQD